MLVTHSEKNISTSVNYFYQRMSRNDCQFIYFPYDIPLEFIKNPSEIRMQMISLSGLRGGIFYKPGALHEAYQLYLALCLLNKEGAKRSGLSPSPELHSDDEHSTLLGAFKGKIPDQGGVDPHEGIEYLLMYTGQKSLACFYGAVPCEFHLNPLLIKMHQIETPCGDGIIYYVSGKEEKAAMLVEELNQLTSELDFVGHRRIGKLLGYKKADIDEYIKLLSTRSYYD